MTDATPTRHQMPPRHERKGWRKPENSKVVTRGSRWGNPYKAKPHGPYEPEDAIALYRRDLFSNEGVQARPDMPRITLKDAMDNLRGFDLVCGCDLDQPCHADLLLSVSNIPWSDVPDSPRVSPDDAQLIAACFTEDQNWGQGYYDYVEAQNSRNPMDPKDYHHRLGLATFCGVHGLIPGFSGKVNWFGFGDLPVAFEAQNDDDPLKTLFWVDDFAKVSGISSDQLVKFWNEGRDEEDRSDLYGLSFYDPERNTHFVQPLLAHSAAMRAMAFLSPWAREFYENTKEMMSHAMAKSGLGETLLGAGSEFTATAHMKGNDGEIVRLQIPIRSFREEDNVPIVRAPWDDATDDELVPITDLCETYEVLRTSDAVHNFLGPKVSEEEATRMAFRGLTPGS